MANDFSFITLRIMQNLIPKKTHEEIAAIVGHPVEDVAKYAMRYCKGKNIVSFQQLADNKKQGLSPASERQLKAIARKQDAEQRRRERKAEKAATKKLAAAQAAAEKKLPRKVPGLNKAKKQKAPKHKSPAPAKLVTQAAAAAAYREAQAARKEDQRLPDRVVDYSKKICVRIDHKTAIYIDAGEDPEEARHRYLARLEKARTFLSDKAKDRHEEQKRKKGK